MPVDQKFYFIKTSIAPERIKNVILKELDDFLIRLNCNVYAHGGWLRDELYSRFHGVEIQSKDIDFAVTKSKNYLKAIAGANKKFKHIHDKLFHYTYDNGEVIEIFCLHEEKLTEIEMLSASAKTRDISINAFFCAYIVTNDNELNAGDVLDFYNGIQHIKNKYIYFIQPPIQAFGFETDNSENLSITDPIQIRKLKNVFRFFALLISYKIKYKQEWENIQHIKNTIANHSWNFGKLKDNGGIAALLCKYLQKGYASHLLAELEKHNILIYLIKDFVNIKSKILEVSLFLNNTHGKLQFPQEIFYSLFLWSSFSSQLIKNLENNQNLNIAVNSAAAATLNFSTHKSNIVLFFKFKKQNLITAIWRKYIKDELHDDETVIEQLRKCQDFYEYIIKNLSLVKEYSQQVKQQQFEIIDSDLPSENYNKDPKSYAAVTALSLRDNNSTHHKSLVSLKDEIPTLSIQSKIIVNKSEQAHIKKQSLIDDNEVYNSNCIENSPVSLLRNFESSDEDSSTEEPDTSEKILAESSLPAKESDISGEVINKSSAPLQFNAKKENAVIIHAQEKTAKLFEKIIAENSLIPEQTKPAKKTTAKNSGINTVAAAARKKTAKENKKKKATLNKQETTVDELINSYKNNESIKQSRITSLLSFFSNSKNNQINGKAKRINHEHDRKNQELRGKIVSRQFKKNQNPATKKLSVKKSLSENENMQKLKTYNQYEKLFLFACQDDANTSLYSGFYTFFRFNYFIAVLGTLVFTYGIGDSSDLIREKTKRAFIWMAYIAMLDNMFFAVNQIRSIPFQQQKLALELKSSKNTYSKRKEVIVKPKEISKSARLQEQGKLILENRLERFKQRNFFWQKPVQDDPANPLFPGRISYFRPRYYILAIRIALVFEMIFFLIRDFWKGDMYENIDIHIYFILATFSAAFVYYSLIEHTEAKILYEDEATLLKFIREQQVKLVSDAQLNEESESKNENSRSIFI